LSNDQWPIRINGNWCMTFYFEGDDTVLVDYQNYHRGRPMIRMRNPAHPGEVSEAWDSFRIKAMSLFSAWSRKNESLRPNILRNESPDISTAA
jgi:hypothetical protein